MYSLAHPEATLQLLSAAEKMLALTGDAVTLCGTYGVEAARSATEAAGVDVG